MKKIIREIIIVAMYVMCFPLIALCVLVRAAICMGQVSWEASEEFVNWLGKD